VGLPVHDPLDVVSALPWVVVPEKAGADVFYGAAGGVDVTALVAGELAEAEPAELLAVTTDRIVWPTSELCSA
jgi:hypothetical protein